MFEGSCDHLLHSPQCSSPQRRIFSHKNVPYGWTTFVFKDKNAKTRGEFKAQPGREQPRRLAGCVIVIGVGVAARRLEPSADNKHAPWAGRGGSSGQPRERGDGQAAGEAGSPLQLLLLYQPRQKEHNNFQKVASSEKEGVRFLRQRDCDAL